jgi:thymidylate synthase
MLKRLIQSKKYQHEEEQYIELIRDVICEGEWLNGRNGRVKSVFGSAMIFSLENDTLPLLTTKKLAWKTCLKELLWFIQGQTNNRILKEQGVHIWDANSTREFLDSRGLFDYQEDELGPIYGFQWRNFNGTADISGSGIDQLQEIIDIIKHPDPIVRASRRLIMTAWNPCQLNKMALPPCHILCQFNVSGEKMDELSCSLYQRSGDIGLGVPFNIASYSFLTHLIAKHCGLKAKEFVYYLGNCHIYENHIEVLQQQATKRIPRYPFPKLTITRTHESINDYTINDFNVLGYEYEPAIKMDMIA